MPDGSTPSRRRSRVERAHAFEPVYRAHHAFVWRCLRRFGVSTETDDAVQEVFVTAYRRLHTFEARCSMEGWLAGIARKIAFRTRRTQARRQRRHDAWAPPVATDDVEHRVQRRQAEVFLQSFLDGLDPDRRGVFVLCDLEGMKGREAAHALGLNQNTAYARLRSARVAFEHACAQLRVDSSAVAQRRVHDDAPSARAVARGWAALVVQISIPGVASVATPAAAGGTWLIHAKAMLATLAVGAVGLTAAKVVLDDGGAGRPVATRATPVVRSSAVLPARPAAVKVAESQPPPVGLPPEPPRAEPFPPARAAPGPTAAVRAPTRAQRVAPPVTADPSPGLSTAELTALDAARSALRADRAAHAADLAQAFLATYAGSELTRDATVVLVKARCALNEPALASAAARGLPQIERAQILSKDCGGAR